jgi:hypothetical protein
MAEEFDTTAAAQTDTVTMPEDGDALTAASVRASLEEMSNGIERLQELVNPGESDSGTQTYVRTTSLEPIMWDGGAVRTVDDNGGTFVPVVYDASAHTTEGSRVRFIWPIDPPHGSLLQIVTVTVNPDSNVGLPDGELNKMEVYEVDIATAVRTLIGSATDPATGGEAAWEALHSWSCSLTAGGRTVDRESCTYHVLVFGEWGTNCTGGGTNFYGCTYQVAVDTIDPAAG